MLVLDGKIASAAVKASLLQQTQALKAAGKRTPHLAAILVGNNGASETYVASKVKNCDETGFGSSLIRFGEDVTESELLAKISELNADASVDGILVQLPLPKHIEDEKIIEFKGDYNEWVEWKERMAKQKAMQPDIAKAPIATEKKQAKVETVAATETKAVPIDKELQKQIQKLQKALAQLEHNIETLNNEKAAIELEMADPSIYQDVAKFQTIEKAYHDKNALIRSMNKEYEMAFNDLVALETK